jgi:hypothetical protein
MAITISMSRQTSPLPLPLLGVATPPFTATFTSAFVRLNG